MIGDETPDKLAAFVTEFIRHESQPDAAVIAVTRAGLRDPAWPPSMMAERYLAMPEIQSMIEVARKFYKPRETKDVSTQTISDDVEQVYQAALQDRQYQAAIGAKKLQAELHSLLKQQIEHTHNVTVKTLSDEELQRRIRQRTINGEFSEIKEVGTVAKSNAS